MIQPLGVSQSERAGLERRARLLAWGGIAWHFVEFAIALVAGIAARSIALIGFGADSLIEAIAGFVVVWLFTGGRVGSLTAERRAQQLIAVSFFVLAAYVGVEAIRTLVNANEPDASWIGIGLAAFTAPTMPLLARAKGRVGQRLNSSATVKERCAEHGLRLSIHRAPGWPPVECSDRMVVGRSGGSARDCGRRSQGRARELARRRLL